MHRAVRVIAVLALLAAGCSDEDTPSASDTTTSEPTTSPSSTSEPTTTAPLAGAHVDWNDRSGVDISLPTGWRLSACDGDAPFLCASTADGTIDGTIALLEYPASDGMGSRDGVEAEAEELYRVTEEDRQITCGADFRLEPDPLVPLTVGGEPGYRYGYQLLDAAGEVTERVILHVVVVDGSRLIVINTAFSDPDGCPGEDPERNEFPIEAFSDIDPYLDQIVAASVLPAGTAPR